ncbi:MAG: substrate-binding domain-containing protein [Chloroflexota bacterium]|nr:substrate-binding domain-containing protein [Chloroflexota bacterium]
MMIWRRAAPLLAIMLVLVSCGGAPQGTTQTGSPTASEQGSQEAYTYESDWGTFTLDPEIQARVQDKIANGEPLDIPVFSWVTGNIFFNPIRQGVEDAAEEFGTTSQLLGPADPDQPQMIADIESYLSRNPDGIAVIPQNAAELQGIVDRLVEDGIPVVVYNTEMAEGAKRLVYVGQDNRKAGEEAGNLLVAKLEEQGITEGTVAMFAVDAAAAYSSELRFPGFIDAVSAALPDIEFAEPVTIGNDPSAAVGAVDAAVRGQEDVVGIYVADEQVLAAGTWVRENADPDDYVVIGHNHLPPELELVASGEIDGLIGQNPYDQGYQSVEWLQAFLITGEAPCGVVCDTGYPVVDSAEQAQEMLDTECGGQGCG